MKKFLLIMLIGLMTGFAVNAQDAGTEKKMSMKEEVGLSSEQDVQIKAIKEEYNGKLKVLEDNATLDDKTRKAQKKTMMTEREEKINALLSKEQQVKYLEYKEKLRAQKEKN